MTKVTLIIWSHEGQKECIINFDSVKHYLHVDIAYILLSSFMEDFLLRAVTKVVVAKQTYTELYHI